MHSGPTPEIARRRAVAEPAGSLRTRHRRTPALTPADPIRAKARQPDEPDPVMLGPIRARPHSANHAVDPDRDHLGDGGRSRSGALVYSLWHWRSFGKPGVPGAVSVAGAA